MLEGKTLLKGSALLLSASIFARGSMLLFRYLAAVTISPHDYGCLSLYISLFLSMATIASFGVGGSLAKLAVREEENHEAHFSLYSNAIIMTLFTSMLATIAFVVALQQSSTGLLTARVVAVTAAGFVFWSYFQISIGFSLAALKFNQVSRYEAGDGITKLLLLLIAWLILGKPTVFTFIITYSMGYLLLFAWAIVNNYKLFGNPGSLNPFRLFDVSRIGRLAGYSSSLMMITFINLFYGFLLRSFLVSYSTLDVALFDMALTFYSVPKMIFVSLVRPVVPYASRNSGGKIMLPPVGKFFFVFFVLLSVALLLYLSGITELCLNKLGLIVYHDSFPIFLVLMLGALFDLGFGFLSSYLQGVGRVRIVAALTVCTFVVTLPISYYAVRSFGVYGAASAQVAFTAILAVMTAWSAGRLVGFERGVKLQEVSS